MPDPDRRAPRPRKSLVAALLIGAASGLGAWFVAAPLRATPVSAVPDVDIETAEGRARLNALIALARMPDVPVPLAAAASAASASGAVQEDPASCGEDQLPKYGNADQAADAASVMARVPYDPDGLVRGQGAEIKPPGVGYTGAMQRLDASLRASADPFDRTAADWLDLGQVFQTPTARLDAVIQDALSTDDPRAYALAFQTCRLQDQPVFASDGLAPDSPNCARLSAAGWARVDPGNALPWLYELSRADKLGDEAAQREALERVAASSRFDLRSHALSAAVARLPIQQRTDLAPQEAAVLIAITNTFFVAFPDYAALTRRCKDAALDDPVRVGECTRIATLMFDNADGLMPRAIGGSLHRLVTGDPGWLDRAHQDQRLAATRYPTAADHALAPCVRERRMLKLFVHVGEVGDMVLVREARAAGEAASAASAAAR